MYKNRREISLRTNGADFNPPRGRSRENDTRINNGWRVLCHICSPNIHPLNTYSYYSYNQGPRDGVNLRTRGWPRMSRQMHAVKGNTGAHLNLLSGQQAG